MMYELEQMVKCVPNFSEGSNEGILTAIKEAIESVPRCKVLNIARGGRDTNRTIFTFVGPKNKVVQAALAAAKVAFETIDMQKHRGEHARIGALDVCPFVPLYNVTIAECVQLAKEFAYALVEQLDVPVYLYEEAQEKPWRKTTRQIRELEYEGLQERFEDPAWEPDYGRPKFVPTWGATITGARKPLITFNVNILGTVEQATKIAQAVRGEGSGPDKPGVFKTVTASAFHLAELDVSQVCMSLTDIERTSMHEVFEACCQVAKRLNVAVVGSEVHGLVPLSAMTKAADYYAERDKILVLHDRQKVRLAVDRLRLSSISEFRPAERIQEYKLGIGRDGPQLSSTVRQFLESVAYGRCSPGVGSAVTCIASMGVALCTMVGLLSADQQDEHRFRKLRHALQSLHSTLQELMHLIDIDAASVEGYMHSQDLPREDEERFAQENDKALKSMCDIPLVAMRCIANTWKHIETIAEFGNPVIGVNVTQLGAQSLHTAMLLTESIIRGNLTKISDSEYSDRVSVEAGELTQRSKQSLDIVLSKSSR